ncbi:MAG: hypothetical protein H6838_01540 [Planctomycetes bacterium]|nr:hypothetical protein [Planctomycetota bacterium]MCB9884140.1 hypothetical protein [Planctomycetota bacterium]
MRRAFSCLLPVLMASVLLAQERSLTVVDLRGTPHERGLTHGKQLREQIGVMMKAWQRDLETGLKVDLDTFVTRFLAATKFDEAARQHTPELLDEIRGIAEGAGQPYERMFAFQLVDELWAQHKLGVGDKCSTIGVDRDGDTPGLVAQNLDLPQWMNRYPTVLRIHHDGSDLQSLVVTLPGLVGGNGLNNHRVAVGVNTILQLRPCPDGLPVAFVVRGILAQRSHADALAFLKRVKHASGQAYTVGGPDHSPCFEASAGEVLRWQPEGRDGWTWHTNHPLVNTDWSPSYLAIAKADARPPEKQMPCSRFEALDRALPAGKRPTFDDVVAALRTTGPETPVCNPMTYVCTVMVLGEKPELHISPGPPTKVPFQVLRFE